MERNFSRTIMAFMASLICLTGCNRNITNETSPSQKQISDLEETYDISLEHDPSQENVLINRFFEDAQIPIGVQDTFLAAINGNAEAQHEIDEYEKNHDDLDWSVINAVFPFRNSKIPYPGNECFFNIGQLYYSGDSHIAFTQNKAIAYKWLEISADKGFFEAAIMSGDMARDGDGIKTDHIAAFRLYSKAFDITPNGIANERLGYCYENGIGTMPDKQKAYDYYMSSSLDGNPKGLYELSARANFSQKEMLSLIKAASSLDYSGGYFATAYGGLEGYTSNNSKHELIDKLTGAWEGGTDPIAVELKSSLQPNQQFDKNIIEVLMLTSYTYSYHAFAEKYGLRPNRGFDDAKDIQFLSDNNADNEFTGCFEVGQFYEYDFDRDGETEIGIPIHSSAGGAFMRDGFGIFKKNTDGLYEYFAGGPACTMRDAMRLIQFEGRIYFITNPFSDTNNDPHNIGAYYVDENGNAHSVFINCNDYKLQKIFSHTPEVYSSEFEDYLLNIEKQALEAVTKTKKHELYSSADEKAISFQNNNFWEEIWDLESEAQDIAFLADIDNDGTNETIRKTHFITQEKYYNDYNWFQVYEDRAALENDGEFIEEYYYVDEFYGLHSHGNLYEYIPVTGRIVQFWTSEFNSITYSIALTREELLYTLYVYKVSNNGVSPVSKSLFFDEVQSMDLKFE